MSKFVFLAERLSIIFWWCIKLLKQFVSLTWWLYAAIIAVCTLIAVVKALLACNLPRRHVVKLGGVLHYEKYLNDYAGACLYGS